jgi:hypothetical protein
LGIKFSGLFNHRLAGVAPQELACQFFMSSTTLNACRMERVAAGREGHGSAGAFHPP